MALAMRPKGVVSAVRGIPMLVTKLIAQAPDLEVVLAGGAVRDCMRAAPPRDFDLFTRTEERAKEVMDRVVAWSGGTFSQTSDYTFTAWVPVEDRVDQLIIQACHGWKWDTPAALLDLFDFTVCQAALWMREGKWEGLVGDNFEGDLRAGKLRLVHGIGSTTVERIVRLYSKGFTPERANSLSGAPNEGACYYHQQMEQLRGDLSRARMEVASLKAQLESEELFIQRVNAKVREQYGDGDRSI